MAQLRRDFLIHGEKDGQEIFDALGSETKEMLWIEESNQRFYAYNHFGLHPEPLVGWFDKYMASATKTQGCMKIAGLELTPEAMIADVPEEKGEGGGMPPAWAAWAAWEWECHFRASSHEFFEIMEAPFGFEWSLSLLKYRSLKSVN